MEENQAILRAPVQKVDSTELVINAANGAIALMNVRCGATPNLLQTLSRARRLEAKAQVGKEKESAPSDKKWNFHFA